MIEEPEQPPPSDVALDPMMPSDISLQAAPTMSDEEVKRTQEAMLKKCRRPASRKAVLKEGRFELNPFFAVTLNDSLIDHSSLGADVSYFLTEVLAVGATGMFYFDDVTDQEFYTRYHFRRVPSVNKYKFTVAGNFSYVPIYGKFSVLNDHIFHFELYFLGGVGVTSTEVIPRDAANEPFSNIALTFPIGVGGRLFFNRWLAAHFALKDYMMIDSFEPATRGVDGEEAKSRAETRFMNNVMFNFGLSFFLPTDFDYSSDS